MTPDGVDFIDKDDAGCVLLGLIEHVAHARGAHAHEHLDEIRTGDGEKRDLGLAGDGPGKQGLAGAGRPGQQHPARNTSAEFLEFGRFLQKFNQLPDLLLGLFHAGHVVEGNLVLFLGDHARLALAEAHGAAAADPALHLAHKENPHTDQQQQREPVNKDGKQQRLFFRRLGFDGDAVFQQVTDQPGIAR